MAIPSTSLKLVLASASPRRLALLQQLQLTPDALMPAELDERPHRGEPPRTLAQRLAVEKAKLIAAKLKHDAGLREAVVLAADTVVAVGRRVLPKCEHIEDAQACLQLLSGRAHRVYTCVCTARPDGNVRFKIVEARVRFKRLSRQEITAYLLSDEWRGKAGGYAIQGLAGCFVVKLVGSYTAVVGLPLYETGLLLGAEGLAVHEHWQGLSGRAG